MLTICWKLAPALATGCTVILKPAEITPVTALELAKIAEEAGFPPGVVNVVPGYGQNGAGERLVEHPDVNKISFSGEGSTARAILRAGADTLKRFTFELGDKSPHIIFDDADIDQAVNAATNSAWTLCGQSCALGSRVLVERSIYDRVTENFAARASKVRVGMSQDVRTHMGPQASAEQLEKTFAYIGYGCRRHHHRDHRGRSQFGESRPRQHQRSRREIRRNRHLLGPCRNPRTSRHRGYRHGSLPQVCCDQYRFHGRDRRHADCHIVGFRYGQVALQPDLLGTEIRRSRTRQVACPNFRSGQYPCERDLSGPNGFTNGYSVRQPQGKPAAIRRHFSLRCRLADSAGQKRSLMAPFG